MIQLKYKMMSVVSRQLSVVKATGLDGEALNGQNGF